nr:class I SAM-dependent methyltransferase [uncultured Lichenicoccus sp.]
MAALDNGPVTGFASGTLFASLSSYLELGIDKVEGWLSATTASMIAQLLVEQVGAGLCGDVCEIGVHHGRLFLVLANATIRGERAVAVDVFDDQQKNIDQSGSGDRAIFERHLACYAGMADVDIIAGSSLELERLGFLSRRFRFVSIDGGHTAAIVANDLRVAERTLLPGGIVALDDILSSHWTGVLTGLAAYVQAGGMLVPFALVPNKLLLTTDAAAAAEGAALMRRHFPLALAKRELEFLHGTVDTYQEQPYYTREGHAGLRRALDDLQRSHAALAARLAASEAEVARLRASTSWRVTAPLRSVVTVTRGRGDRQA